MPEDPVTAISTALAAGLALTTQKDQQLNTSAETAAAIAAEIQKLKDQINKALEQNDLATIRTLCA